MPSIEDTANEEPCLVKNDFVTRDVEVLVQEIKENLRLSGYKSRPTYGRQFKATRPSPYRVPSRSRSWGDSMCEDCLNSTTKHCERHSYFSINKSVKSTTSTDDPYQMLQELLRDGGLIKEAVRRLEFGLSAKQRYLYDSDEECRTPLRVCNGDL